MQPESKRPVRLTITFESVEPSTLKAFIGSVADVARLHGAKNATVEEVPWIDTDKDKSAEKILVDSGVKVDPRQAELNEAKNQP